jgi:hypothetical protein
MPVDPKHWKRSTAHIREILLKDWDPIGVAEIPEAQSEYDSYVGRLYSLLAAGPNPDAIAAHLERIETDAMGLYGGNAEARRVAAIRLSALKLHEDPAIGPFPCPACGFIVFDEPPGSYHICPICNWEDDQVQLRHPALAGGANHYSLCDAQRRSIQLVPLSIQLASGFRRDPHWRPLTSDECAQALSTLSAGGHLPAIGPEFNAQFYYWLSPHSNSAG